MTYRDEKGALQAKVGELENELDAARRKIAELSGTAPSAATTEGETLGPPSSLGVPTSLRIERSFDGELTLAGYEAIAALIKERLGMETTQVGARMTTLDKPRQPAGRIEIAVRDGRTHVILERSWADRAPGAFVGAGMIALFAGVMTAGVLHDALHLSDAMAFANFFWAAPLFGGIASFPLRALARGQVEKELEARRGTFAAIVALAEKHRAPGVRARVEVAGAPSEPEQEAGVAASINERAGSR